MIFCPTLYVFWGGTCEITCHPSEDEAASLKANPLTNKKRPRSLIRFEQLMSFSRLQSAVRNDDAGSPLLEAERQGATVLGFSSAASRRQSSVMDALGVLIFAHRGSAQD